MQKKLCITTFVFGEGFEEYIPLYIYSVLKSYNDYYPMIFLQGALSETVRRQLEMLKELGEFKVVENYLSEEKLNNQQGKAIRWVLNEPKFGQFDAVYIGDIDIFILPEEPGLYEQHIEHCRVLDLPYSNAVRPAHRQKFSQALRKTADVFADLGPRSAVRFLFRRDRQTKRLSGLHFVRTAEYFERIRPLIPKYKQLILDDSYKSRKATIHHEKGFNNESLLYDMTKEAGMKLRTHGEYSIDPGDCGRAAFRPHHGLHMGIFKTDNVIRNNRNILNTQTYKEYYQKFRGMTANDPVFDSLKQGFSKYITEQLERIHKYYG